MPLTIEFAMEVGDDNRKNGLRTDRDTTLEGTRRSESAAPPRHTQLPVVDQAGSVEGLTSLNRLRAVPQPQRSTTTLREVAVPLTRIPTGQPDESLSALLPRFSRTTDGHILVLSGSELVGIIAQSDINRIAAEHGLPMAIPAATPSPHATEPRRTGGTQVNNARSDHGTWRDTVFLERRGTCDDS